MYDTLKFIETLTASGIPEEQAKAILYAVKDSGSFATKLDIAELKLEIVKAIADSQKWTVTAIFAAVGIFAAIVKYL